jgi:hypothetical protein
VRVTQRYRLQAVTRAAAALCLMVLAMAACSDPKAPTITPPAGYTAASNDKAGFAVAVPADWTQIPLAVNPADFDKDANALRLANPKLASILNQARVLGQSGGLFMAVAKDGVANVNLTADKPDQKTVEAVVTASVEALKGVQATNFAQEAATLSGKPAIRLAFRIPVATDAGTVPTESIQYYMLDNGKAYILTVAAASAEVASTVAGSFKVR